MKGIMVPLLLVTLMASTAIGQQQHADHGPPPFLLQLDDQRIDNIRNNPMGEQTYLPPELMGKVHEVIIRHDNFRADPSFQLGYWRRVPEDMQGKLVPFVISVTDEQIAHLKIDPEGLQSFLPEAGMSRVNQIIIRRIDFDQNAGGNNRSNLQGAGIADSSNQDKGAFSPDTFAPLQPRAQNQAANSNNFSIDPQARAQQANRNSISNIEPRFGGSNDFRAPTNATTTPQNRIPFNDTRNWQFQNTQPNSGLNNQAIANQNLLAQPRQNPATMTNQERIQYEMDLLERKRLENEALQLRNLQLQRQLAEQTEQEERNRLNELMRQQTRQMIDSQNGIRYASTDQNLPLTGSQPLQVPTGSMPNRNNDFNNVPSENSMAEINRQRTAMAPKTGVGGLSMSIPFPEKTGEQNANNNQSPAGLQANSNKVTEKTNGLLWFMLFCSLGINLYLWWISRSFYVRYNELADELRETFTSSSV